MLDELTTVAVQILVHAPASEEERYNLKLRSAELGRSFQNKSSKEENRAAGAFVSGRVAGVWHGT